ncbi:MAG TPA: NERD domain-containing protein [Thermodesulfovibrionales bacterium]|nr:NERD domain-containing protein [Thermodesulfovibrionales bacterium]
MIIKKKESRQSDIDELISLLELNLTDEKRFLMERELKLLKSGEKGEKDSTYYIDFDFGSSQNWAVIHDLRLEFEDKVAQIDHLLISRFFEFYVLETKSFSYALKITNDGEFLASYNNKYYGIPSPIEQNRRHIVLLEKVIKARNIMPTRLGIQMLPAFKSYILVSPQSRVMRPSNEHFDTSMVIKTDTLRSLIDKESDKITVSGVIGLGKLSSSETIMDVARRLVKSHKAGKVDFRSRFGITDKAAPKGNKVELSFTDTAKAIKAPICPKCCADMVLRTATKGSKVGLQFWGCCTYPKCNGTRALS